MKPIDQPAIPRRPTDAYLSTCTANTGEYIRLLESEIARLRSEVRRLEQIGEALARTEGDA